MGILMSILRKIGHFFLAILRILRKALCCRRLKSETEMLLPLTLHITNVNDNTEQIVSFQEWHPWDDAQKLRGSNIVSSNVNCQGTLLGINKSNSLNQSNEDFFRDMIPKIKKPKKIVVKNQQEFEQGRTNSSRLSMDPNCFTLPGPDLGLIEPGFSNWEENEINEGQWDSDSLIREKRLLDREKRIAEHQRRKQEKENQRRALTLAEITEKAKSS